MTNLGPIQSAAQLLLRRCIAGGLRIVTAESCTGGLVAAAITAIPGASAVFDRGFVTYSAEAKTELLGVPAELILRHTVVSAEVAIAMAEGALARTARQRRAGTGLRVIALAATGYAGPGARAGQPVGLVHYATASAGRPTRASVSMFGDLGRDVVRDAATQEALRLLLELADEA